MKNLLKEKLKKGEFVVGTFVALAHPDVTERLSRLGFDWIVIDGEHSPMGFETMQTLLQAMNGSGCTPIIRPQWNDMVTIKRILDIGAHGVIVPWLNTKKDAEYAVHACKYPPEGIRGFGPRRAALFDSDYFKTANDEIMVIAQIETEEATRNIDDILSVKGIDACFIGPQDLSVSMGTYPPKWDNLDARYATAYDRVIDAAAKWGKPVGTYAYQENIEWVVNKGIKLISIESADTFLLRGAKMALEGVRKLIEPHN